MKKREWMMSEQQPGESCLRSRSCRRPRLHQPPCSDSPFGEFAKLVRVVGWEVIGTEGYYKDERLLSTILSGRPDPEEDDIAEYVGAALNACAGRDPETVRRWMGKRDDVMSVLMMVRGMNDPTGWAKSARRLLEDER